jgi:hypothetical protein
MSQHDYNLADAAGASFRSDLNSALSAILSRNSGATAPSTTVAYMLWVDTTAGVIKRRNAANSAWIIESTIDETFVLSRSSNTILDESDRGKVLIATGSYTQTVTAAATLTDGWSIDIVVDSGVTLVIDPNASETIDGATTKSIVGPAQFRLVCNGTLFRTIGAIEIATQAELEAATDTAKAVTPGRVQYHPGVSKFWVAADPAGSIVASYNVTSITDGGVGILGVTIATDFSSANWSGAAQVQENTNAIGCKFSSATAAGTCEVRSYVTTTGTLTDPTRFFVQGFGDQ